MGVLAIGERRDGLSEPSRSAETYVCNGSGVTVNGRKTGNIVLDPFFNVDHDSDLENGSRHCRCRVKAIANVQLNGGSKIIPIHAPRPALPVLVHLRPPLPTWARPHFVP